MGSSRKAWVSWRQVLLNLSLLTAGSCLLAIGINRYSRSKSLSEWWDRRHEYTRGRITDAVVTGFNQRKSVLIISESPAAIAGRIHADLNRGVTFSLPLEAIPEKEVVFSIITLTELAKVKELVFDVDPKAFMVVNDTLEVIGKRHGSRRTY